MTASIIDGVAIAKALREELAVRVGRLAPHGLRPGLAVVIVGEDPASQVYVRNKAKACEATGLYSEVHALPGSTPESELLDRIAALNADPSIHGILVQLPVPKHIRKDAVLAAIDPSKDVDGFHAESMGALVAGESAFPPCTPWGCLHLLETAGVPVWGRHAVVLGASTIVGKPMALILMNKGATVTVCNSKTPDPASHTRQADIVIAAVGRPQMVAADWIKPGAAVIDVGINRTTEGKLVGDVDFAGVMQVAGHLTPVPGGVGPMTIAMLLANTVKACERRAQLAGSDQETRLA
jgi:methylenetetrahydrofolate dehydrogenase (NADP+) / methenyltetrahydrofolate cyclohydrolase